MTLSSNLWSLEAYRYDLPKELIAQVPSSERDDSRLMVVDRASGNMTGMPFCELTDFLERGDSLVLNDTRVIPARLIGSRDTGGRVEIFLVRCIEAMTWEVLAKPAKKLKPGMEVGFGENFSCVVKADGIEGRKVVRFCCEGDFYAALNKHGRTPLPPYIRREVNPGIDNERYQTIYANRPGALAAPTAGLHFSESMLRTLSQKEVEQVMITLHVGLGTFRPVHAEDIRDHEMHAEIYHIDVEAADRLNHRSLGSRRVCVGTTCCRTLEAVADDQGVIVPGEGATDLFIYPGYRFKYVDMLLTNFHLPGSSLLMLVTAFGGYDLIMEAYAKAVRDRYRFFSYGDAMLII